MAGFIFCDVEALGFFYQRVNYIVNSQLPLHSINIAISVC